MYGNESKEDGEIRFHYKREERIGDTEESGGKDKTSFWKIFRLNRTTLIVLLDIIVLTVVFIIFRPMMSGNDNILETDTFRAELSGFLFDEKAYVSIRVEALQKNSGGSIAVQVWYDENEQRFSLTDTAPRNTGEVTTVRVEIPAEGESESIHGEILLPDMEKARLLTAVLKQ